MMLAALIPTICMTGIGIVLLALHSSSTTNVVTGVLVLAFCTSGITGYILTSIFMQKGASLARVQNDFVSAVSHELRTPVTSIRLLLESLHGDRLAPEERDQVLSLLARETGRLEGLVNRVLELSRLESGAYDYARDRVDVRALVDEAIAAFDAVTLTNPTPIERRVPAGLMLVGERATLVRAILNLLTNAWKYTGERKQISVEAREAGRWVEILVRDNGTGIDAHDAQAIYEQFKRGRAAHETGASGLGLGLAFVRAIVNGQRGRLDFESQPGATTFRIRLPRVRDTAQQAAHVGEHTTA